MINLIGVTVGFFTHPAALSGPANNADASRFEVAINMSVGLRFKRWFELGQCDTPNHRVSLDFSNTLLTTPE